MADHVLLTGAVSIDGGLSNNTYFCDFLARALGRQIEVPGTADLTGLGIAQLALIGAGLATLSFLPSAPPPRRRVETNLPLKREHHERFRNAVERCRNWR